MINVHVFFKGGVWGGGGGGRRMEPKAAATCGSWRYIGGTQEGTMPHLLGHSSPFCPPACLAPSPLSLSLPNRPALWSLSLPLRPSARPPKSRATGVARLLGLLIHLPVQLQDVRTDRQVSTISKYYSLIAAELAVDLKKKKKCNEVMEASSWINLTSTPRGDHLNSRIQGENCDQEDSTIPSLPFAQFAFLILRFSGLLSAQLLLLSAPI